MISIVVLWLHCALHRCILVPQNCIHIVEKLKLWQLQISRQSIKTCTSYSDIEKCYKKKKNRKKLRWTLKVHISGMAKGNLFEILWKDIISGQIQLWPVNWCDWPEIVRCPAVISHTASAIFCHAYRLNHQCEVSENWFTVRLNIGEVLFGS